MEFKVINTQEEFDAAIAERLKRQKESIESKYSDYDSLREENLNLKTQLGEVNHALESSKKEVEGFNDQLNELTGKVSQYEMAQMKTTIALKNGIPYDLADRLNGTDEAALTEDAKRLASFIGQSTPIAPLKSTEPVVSSEDDAYKNLLDSLKI